MTELLKVSLKPLTILKQTWRISKLKTPIFRVRKLRGDDFEIKEHISKDLLEETGLLTNTNFDLNAATPKICKVKYCGKLETLKENSLYYLDSIEKVFYRGGIKYMFTIHGKTGMMVSNEFFNEEVAKVIEELKTNHTHIHTAEKELNKKVVVMRTFNQQHNSKRNKELLVTLTHTELEEYPKKVEPEEMLETKHMPETKQLKEKIREYRKLLQENREDFKIGGTQDLT